MDVLRLALCLSILVLVGCSSSPTDELGNEEATRSVNHSGSIDEFAYRYTYVVVNEYPHDGNAYTEGLAFTDGALYEGTGLYGQSSLRRVDMETGEVLQLRDLPKQFFGEGIAVWENKIIQLTWKSHLGFVYDRSSFDLLDEFEYQTEGWGLTFDGTHFIMSDGTSALRFLDVSMFEEIRRIEVQDDSGPVDRINELEYINGKIYANVWQTDYIAIISPDTGRVLGWIDLRGLLRAEYREHPVDVLNGIAYDAENDRLFVTGKLWPKLFEIEIVASE